LKSEAVSGVFQADFWRFQAGKYKTDDLVGGMGQGRSENPKKSAGLCLICPARCRTLKGGRRIPVASRKPARADEEDVCMCFRSLLFCVILHVIVFGFTLLCLGLRMLRGVRTYAIPKGWRGTNVCYSEGPWGALFCLPGALGHLGRQKWPPERVPVGARRAPGGLRGGSGAGKK